MNLEKYAIRRNGEEPEIVVPRTAGAKQKQSPRLLAKLACLAAWAPLVPLGVSTVVSTGCGELDSARTSAVCEVNDGFQHGVVNGITNGIASLIGKLPGMPDIAPTEPALNPSQPYLS